MKSDIHTRIDKSKACLVLGAVGDALGATVEFMSLDEIMVKYGDDSQNVKGIQYLDEAYGRKGAVTDDTQMTLFVADGLLSAFKRGMDRGILAKYYHYTTASYMKWLETQGEASPDYPPPNRWGSQELFDAIKAQGRRGPGNTCLSALKTISKTEPFAQNDSKGCGTVMRVAPVGIFFGNLYYDRSKESLQEVYDEGARDAAITHGNETAHHASGLLAVIFALALSGQRLEAAARQALELFGTPDVAYIANQAIELAGSGADVDNLQTLGEGWIAEEALAIALYCSLLCAKDVLSVEDALRLAVNHDGDSDSTGAITGNLIGISLGMDCISQNLIGKDTEVAELTELFEKYGEELINIIGYRPDY